jgi:hypothetical protein
VLSRATEIWQRWKQERVDRDGAGAAELAEVERRHRVRLPDAFRELWSLSDGTGAPDRHWLIFFQVSDLLQELYAARNARGLLLLFADWQQGMGALGLRLEPDDHGVVMSGNKLERVATSFDEFVGLYLARPKLWPPPP